MKSALKILSIFCLFLGLSLSAVAENKKAAKAIIVKGKVSALIKGKVVKIKRGDWIPEGAQVKTEPRSFTKLIFSDKSTMNVGPDSQMKIESFPQDEAGIIDLVKGQVRSKVTKNYMNIKDKKKSKLFIKTKTAAMGVRGTDFQVSFNTVNQATSLITFEGAVAMAKLTENLQAGRPTQRALEAVVSGQTAVMVQRGQYSGASPKTPQATIPVKISPVQLETLEKNETPGVGLEPDQASQSDQKPKKKFRNVVPPGMDSKKVANESSEVDKVMKETMGSQAVQKADQQVSAESLGPDTAPPPEGSVDMATGAVAPKAGGFVDLATAQYIQPPPGSSFDANAGVYVPPPEIGSVDSSTGNYTNDHYVLNPDGTFTEKPPEPNEPSRDIASTDGDSPNGGPPSDEPPPPPPDVHYYPSGEPYPLDGPDVYGDAPPPELINYAEEITQETEQTIEDFNNSDNNLIYGDGTTTKVNFDVTIQ